MLSPHPCHALAIVTLLAWSSGSLAESSVPALESAADAVCVVCGAGVVLVASDGRGDGLTYTRHFFQRGVRPESPTACSHADAELSFLLLRT
eukprot:45265-Rhodomonas_salina.1